MLTNATGAPKDYSELYVHYFPMIRSIVAKAGIAPADVEDVSMDLLTKFMERDALSWYDPEKLHDVGKRPRLEGERHRPAKFQGLLRRFCCLYVRQHLDRQALRSRREPHHLEDPARQGQGDGDGTWADAHGELLRTEPHATLEATLTTNACLQHALDLLEAEAHARTTEHRAHLLRGDRMAATHAARRAAEAERARQALLTAHALASGRVHVIAQHASDVGNCTCNCERVTARNVAALNGWGASSASQALRTARTTLATALSA